MILSLLAAAIAVLGWEGSLIFVVLENRESSKPRAETAPKEQQRSHKNASIKEGKPKQNASQRDNVQ